MSKTREKHKPKASDKKQASAQTSPPLFSAAQWILIILSFIVIWFGHTYYLYTLFENHWTFSHLADIERECAYRTEMGLYFSFYKTLVTADSFTDGIRHMIHENRTEAGHTLNTLERFNLYPEVVLAALFRGFTWVTKSLKLVTENCYIINRGEGLSSIQSCVGIGNLHYFYVAGAYITSGSTVALVFLQTVFLSKSYLGGLIAAASFFYNHGEATRAMWTPPLRETFGFPFMLLQNTAVTYLFINKHSRSAKVVLATASLFAMLSWQFTQFVSFVDIICLYAVYVLEFNDIFDHILRAKIFAFVAGYILLFCNSLLLSSVYFPTLCAVFIAVSLTKHSDRSISHIWFIAKNALFFVPSAVVLKLVLSYLIPNNDGDHIFDILRSKFTNFASFHTQLYTCAVEFDFLDSGYALKLTQTGLIPAALVVLLVVVYQALTKTPWLSPVSQPLSLPGELYYHSGLVVCFGVMAALIMRLKLFLTPQLCIVAGAVLSNKVWAAMKLDNHKRFKTAVFVALIAAMTVRGYQNISAELDIYGEYSNIPQEQMFDWIGANTHKNAVFAGPMAVMANLKLSTNRRIYNHPHYENKEIRDRTLIAYSIYSRKAVSEIYQMLKREKIDYIVFQTSSCTNSHPKPRCTYIEMWDLEDPQNAGNFPTCHLFTNPGDSNSMEQIKPFRVVYNAYGYTIYKL